MKYIFLCIFLVNIVFFFWQYKKGAPQIYMPPSYKDKAGLTSKAQKILLLNEISEKKKAARVLNPLKDNEAQHQEELSGSE